MEYLFLNYELSLLAKKKGFDEKCLTSYKKDKTKTIASTFGIKNSMLEDDHFKNMGYAVTVPLFQQVTEWFLTKNLSIERHVNKRYFTWIVIDMDNNRKIYKSPESLNPYEHRNEAISAAFKII